MFDPTLTDPGAPGDDYLPTGTTIGSYVISELIAEGGMGSIYAATHTVLSRKAAVKVLRTEMVALRSAREGLLKEAQILDTLNHPAVTQLYDAGVLPDGRPWIAMELLDGECLGDRLQERKRLPPDEVMRIVDGIAEILMSAHARGYVHRDIKPENVMLRETEHGLVPRLIDWGIASSMHQEAKHEIAAGTPHYMSPEQVRGDRGDARTDVYSLGAVAFEMLAGRTPFVGDSALDVAMQQISRPVPDINIWVDNLTPGWRELLHGMLAKKPEDRPDLATVRTALRAIDQGPKTPKVEVSFDIPLDDWDGTDGYYASSTATRTAADHAPNVVRTRWTPAEPVSPLSDRPTLRLARIHSSAAASCVCGTIEDEPAAHVATRKHN
jgi:serine/threonine-protein kinase